MIERASANDLMQRATDVGPLPPQIASVLVLDPGRDVAAEAVASEAVQRLAGIPRLRQVLRPAPLGCGRAYWADAPHFDAGRHAHVVDAADPGDEPALLTAALGALTAPLPKLRPPWNVTVVRGLAQGRVAIVVVVEHVVVDGVGGLALLEALAGPPPKGSRAPRPPPSSGELARDAWSRRAGAVRRLPGGAHRLIDAAKEMRAAPPRAVDTPINRATGRQRALATVQVSLDAVRAGAHACDATINDALLAAVLSAMGLALRRRGNDVEQLSVSIPVSQRGEGASALGNQVGVMPVLLPVPAIDDDPGAHLRRVSRIVRTRKASASGASSQVVEPAFRALAGLGVMRWFMDHQRMVNTIVSNVTGPAREVQILGMPVTRMIPISGVYGNVPVGFTAMSYAGELVVTVMVDPQLVPDVEALTADLQHQLDLLAALEP
ncbi:MAG: wax ester/triacylglycerol synthase domain-containing protein [Actinomycetes bacterium]